MEQCFSKEIYFESHANKEMSILPPAVKQAFVELLKELGNFGILRYPEARKLSGYNIYEMRVRNNGIYRCIYCYEKEYIVLLSVFKKKTQKTPIRELKKAKRRKTNLKIT